MDLPVLTISEDDRQNGMQWFGIGVDGYYLTHYSSFDFAIQKCVQILDGITTYIESVGSRDNNAMAERRTAVVQPITPGVRNVRSVAPSNGPVNRPQRVSELATLPMDDEIPAPVNPAYQRISEVAQTGPMPWLTGKIADEIGEGVDFAIIYLTGETREIQMRDNKGLSMAGAIQKLDDEGNPTGESQDVEFVGKAIVGTVEAVAKEGEWEGCLIARLIKHWRTRTQWYWILQ